MDIMIIKDFFLKLLKKWQLVFVCLQIINYGLLFAFILWLKHDNIIDAWCYLNQLGLFRSSILIAGFLSMIFALIALTTGLNKNRTINEIISIMILLSGSSCWLITSQMRTILRQSFQSLSTVLLVYLHNEHALNINVQDRDAKAVKENFEYVIDK